MADEQQPKYAGATEARQIVTFPGVAGGAVEDPTLDAWGVDRSARLDLLLAKKGVQVPVQSPPMLVATLRQAVTYGIAAMLEAAAFPGQAPADESASSSVYEEQYAAIVAQLDALTADDLRRMGVPMTDTREVATPRPQFSAVGNSRRRPPHAWYHSYPWRML